MNIRAEEITPASRGQLLSSLPVNTKWESGGVMNSINSLNFSSLWSARIGACIQLLFIREETESCWMRGNFIFFRKNTKLHSNRLNTDRQYTRQLSNYYLAATVLDLILHTNRLSKSLRRLIRTEACGERLERLYLRFPGLPEVPTGWQIRRWCETPPQRSMPPSAGSAAVAEYLSGKDARMLISADAVRTEQFQPAFLCYVRPKK